jgi:hypothetical protein
MLSLQLPRCGDASTMQLVLRQKLRLNQHGSAVTRPLRYRRFLLHSWCCRPSMDTSLAILLWWRSLFFTQKQRAPSGSPPHNLLKAAAGLLTGRGAVTAAGSQTVHAARWNGAGFFARRYSRSPCPRLGHISHMTRSRSSNTLYRARLRANRFAWFHTCGGG